MVDRFDRLRHNTIIRSNYQHCDIRGIGASHTHRRKRLMSRRIQERNALSIDCDRIGTDRLCDTACFLIRHVSFTNSIQQRSFTVIYVSHDTDNRCSAYHSTFIFFVFLQQLLNNVYFNFFLTDNLIFNRDTFRIFIAYFRVQCHDLSLQEKFLNDHRRLDLHLIRQLFDRQRLRNRNNLNLFLRLLLRLLLWLNKAACLIAVLYCRIILFIDQILFGTFISVLINPALFFFPVLFHVLARRLGHKTLLIVIFLKSIVLSATASLRAVKISTAPVRACTRAATPAITLIVVIRWTTLSLRSAIFSCTSRSPLFLRCSGGLLGRFGLLPLTFPFSFQLTFPFTFALQFSFTLLLLPLLHSAFLLLSLAHLIWLSGNRNRFLGRSYDLVRHILGLNRSCPVSILPSVPIVIIVSSSTIVATLCRPLSLALPLHLGVLRIAHKDDFFLLRRLSSAVFTLSAIRILFARCFTIPSWLRCSRLCSCLGSSLRPGFSLRRRFCSFLRFRCCAGNRLLSLRWCFHHCLPV